MLDPAVLTNSINLLLASQSLMAPSELHRANLSNLSTPCYQVPALELHKTMLT